MNFVVKMAGVVIGGIILFTIIAALLTFPTKWLWNWLMPVIFKLPRITTWQALGLNALSGLLIRSTNTSSSK